MDEIEKIKRKKIEELMRRSEYPSEPIKITDENFNSIIQKYPLVIVDCWAPWCMPCRIMGPLIDELAKKFKGKIVFGKLSVEENKEIPVKFGIRSIPTLLVFKNGKLIDRIVGVYPDLEGKMRKYIE